MCPYPNFVTRQVPWALNGITCQYATLMFRTTNSKTNGRRLDRGFAAYFWRATRSLSIASEDWAAPVQSPPDCSSNSVHPQPKQSRQYVLLGQAQSKPPSKKTT